MNQADVLVSMATLLRQASSMAPTNTPMPEPAYMFVHSAGLNEAYPSSVQMQFERYDAVTWWATFMDVRSSRTMWDTVSRDEIAHHHEQLRAEVSWQGIRLLFYCLKSEEIQHPSTHTHYRGG